MADTVDTLTTVMRVTGFTEVAAAFSNASRLADMFAKSEEATGFIGLQIARAQEVLGVAIANANIAREQAVVATAGMGQAAAMATPEFAALTVAEQAAATAATELAAAEAAAAPPLFLIAAALAVVLAGLATIVASVRAFSQETEQLFRVQTLLHNLGEAMPIDKFQQMTQEISRATGFLAKDIDSASATLLQAGIHANELPRVLKIAADEARTTSRSFDEIVEILAKGDIGKARGLGNLGIGPGGIRETGTIHGNQALILEEIQKRARDASQAFMETLPGAQANFARAMDELLRKLGAEFAPTVIRVLNSIASVADFISDHMSQISHLLYFTTFGLVGRAPGDKRDLMKDLGGDKAATERTLGVIAENTKQMPDLIKGIIGGTGAFRETYATGAVQHAMMI